MSNLCNCSHDHAAMNAALDQRRAERDRLTADLAAARADVDRWRSEAMRVMVENKTALEDLRERAAKAADKHKVPDHGSIAAAIRALPLVEGE